MDTSDGGRADWLESNRAGWDARTPIHLESEFYDLDGFRAGADPLRAREVEELGEVSGRSLVHLQCHIGTDTLAWARRGASVTGVDFSGKSVEAARGLAAELGVDGARFVESDVYRAAEALGGETFDIVYTGVGALVWLPELGPWAETVAALLKPGGVFYLHEFHPVTDLVAEDGRTLAEDYFRREPDVWDTDATYTDGDQSSLAGNTSYEWVHALGEVVTALARAGLRIEFLHEHDGLLFQRYPALEQQADGYFRFPEGKGWARIPMMYSIRARRD